MDPSGATAQPDQPHAHEPGSTLAGAEWIEEPLDPDPYADRMRDSYGTALAGALGAANIPAPPTKSRTYVFGGFNIRGTPPMPRSRVRSDVKVIKRRCDLAVMNEYRWDYYWDLLKRLVDTEDAKDWGTYPSLVKGLAMPVFGGQPCIWKKRYFRRVKSKRHLLHKGVRKVSESRQLRGVMLEDIAVYLRVWEATAHFVVKGDAHSDTRLRKSIMRTDLRNFRAFIMELMKSGEPIIFQGDLNIHKGTWAYRALLAIVRELGGRIVGVHGIEFTIIFDQHSDTKVRVEATAYVWPRPKGPLFTDHEGRLTKFHLRRA